MDKPLIVWLRVSRNGVPHMVVMFKEHNYSITYMNRQDNRHPSKEKFYRIKNYDTQETLLDCALDSGGSFNLENVLTGLHEKYYATTG